jgi:glycosyltransferase involved in cell wall biosynthesis
MSRQRILLLITNLGKGGAQRVAYDHALAFGSFCVVEEAVFDRDQDTRIYDSGLPLHELKRGDWLSRLGPLGRLFSRALALRGLVQRGKFDVVISHMDGANWVNVLSMSAARKILVVHGTVLRDDNVRGLKQWLRLNVIFPYVYNWADATVAVSEGIARELRSKGRVRRVQSIPNFFDVPGIARQACLPLPQELAPVFARPGVLVTSGRLAEQKKQAHLIDMLAALRAKGVQTCLVILGDGELRESLLRKCAEQSLKTYQVWNPLMPCHDGYDVYFLGYVSNPFQYLARSSLFVFPSGWEGFPLALCEAMIAGVPVVSADCPTGPREILAPGTVNDAYDLREAQWGANGVLMPLIETPRDLSVWVDTVHHLLSDAAARERLSERGAQAMQLLDKPQIVQRWQDVLEASAHGQ